MKLRKVNFPVVPPGRAWIPPSSISGAEGRNRFLYSFSVSIICITIYCSAFERCSYLFVFEKNEISKLAMELGGRLVTRKDKGPGSTPRTKQTNQPTNIFKSDQTLLGL